MLLDELFSINSADDPTVILMDHFVDCECESDYIHFIPPRDLNVIQDLSLDYIVCDKCKSTYDECPNSRMTEILSWLFDKHLNTIRRR